VIKYTESYSNSGAITWAGTFTPETAGTYTAAITNAGSPFGTLKCTVNVVGAKFEFDTEYGTLAHTVRNPSTHVIDDRLFGLWRTETGGNARSAVSFDAIFGVEAAGPGGSSQPSAIISIAGNQEPGTKWTVNLAAKELKWERGSNSAVIGISFVDTDGNDIEPPQTIESATRLRIGADVSGAGNNIFRRIEQRPEGSGYTPEQLLGRWNRTGLTGINNANSVVNLYYNTFAVIAGPLTGPTYTNFSPSIQLFADNVTYTSDTERFFEYRLENNSNTLIGKSNSTNSNWEQVVATWTFSRASN
jgi:hypothetical protein